MGKGSSPKVKPSPSDQAAAKQITDIENQFGTPIRQAITPSVLQTLGGPGVFQTELPGVNRDTIEKQFAQAKSSIMNDAPVRGGQLAHSLVDLNTNRAFSVADATNQQRQLGIQRALGLVPAALPGADAQMNTLANIGRNETQANMQNAQQQAASQQAKGQGMGQLAGTALKALMML